MWYGGAHGGFYETLTSLVYFALLATPLPATYPVWCACLLPHALPPLQPTCS
jgi:hypothetical protein